ncbi:acyl-CoA dehydrogenase family protein [Pseudonocardia xishanensis]|uniref:Acyl-CoA dehydrogenase family protein n=1 Tax=Pseudonocardia xishanensis TaxID=630995 RepID=A0ABP8RH22_9PSEU
MSFRDDVASFLATTPRPEGLHDYGPTPASSDVAAGRRWQRTLAEHGYACLHWPREHGGSDASVADQAAFAEECARAGVPRQLSMVGPDLVGPVLMGFGSRTQQDLHLPRIRDGRDLWCQLFSEPGAGSDLAAVTTRAIRQPDGSWRIRGQKVWTSAADSADLGLLLARSGGPGPGGLSVFVVPMANQGITVRPLRQMDGESKFNEVFLDDVVLHADQVVGTPGAGWQVAKATLGRERLSLGANAVGMFESIAELETAAAEHGRLDDSLRDEIVKAWIRVWLMRVTWERAIEEETDPSGATFSVLKLLTSETYRDIADLGGAALGPAALEEEQPLVKRMLVGHAQTILGGTSEIQRTILAERILGLPRAPR